MSTKKLRTIENLILITFPLVLFAGCAGSDIKPITELPGETLISEGSITDTGMSTTETVSALPVERIDLTPKETILQPVQIAELTKTMSLRIPEKKVFYFETNAHQLTDAQRTELKEHAAYLIANPGAVLVINGHADLRGTENYNQILSEKRAKETYLFLVDRGVSESQLLTKGFGELVPLHSENNWDENRRVELEYTDPTVISSM